MFAERLKQLRKEKGMTQIGLAEELGVSKGTVAMWETGRRRPQFETLADLCNSNFPQPNRTENKVHQGLCRK